MNINKQLPIVVKQRVNRLTRLAKHLSRQNWLRISFFIGFLFIISQKEMSIQLTFGSDGTEAKASVVQTSLAPTKLVSYQEKKKEAPINSSPKWWEKIQKESDDIRDKLNLANSATAVGLGLSAAQQKKAARFSNLGFVLSPGFAKEHKIAPSIVRFKKQICLDYIDKYAKTAQEEAKLYNIPASITLAQGLLESNAGDSKLATKEKNHFGIKCRKKCIGCRCANYTDDSRYDMFRIFDSAWMSFREHSKLLQNTRYKKLHSYERTNYKAWANGLQSAGYATDKRYAKKLIQIIEAFELDRFDK